MALRFLICFTCTLFPSLALMGVLETSSPRRNNASIIENPPKINSIIKSKEADQVDAILQRISDHSFRRIEDGFTHDNVSDEHGVADLSDNSWRVRLLAVRDLIRLGESGIPQLISRLEDKNAHVRELSAMVLGILEASGANQALIKRLREDPDSVVRTQAASALGQIGLSESLTVLKETMKTDSSRDVIPQCEMSITQIENNIKSDPDLAASYRTLDESKFNSVQVNQPAVDFELKDTNGKTWRLSDFKGEKTVVLIWVFADWCPVCHNEFHELIELEKEIARADIQVFTVECHDRFRCRVMTGQEEKPHYWFKKKPLFDQYAEEIWWPHLVDLAGAVGATYGVDPMEFVVHSEWINRPSTVIVDKNGVVRFAYYGTFWGDRPTIEQTLEMVHSEDYQFEHPDRRKMP
jgi:peroxiredoxin